MFPNLEGELRKRNITRKKIACDLDLNVSTVSRKLTEDGRLKLSEAIRIRELYFPEMKLEYLFNDNFGAKLNSPTAETETAAM